MKLLAEKFLNELCAIHFQVGGYVSQDGIQGSDSKLFVCGDGEVMFASLEKRRLGAGDCPFAA